MTHRHTTTTTTTRRHGLFGRRRPVVHQKRHATLGDKVSGALKKLKGTIMGRPGEKVSPQPPYRTMSCMTGLGSHRPARRRFF
ncbi:hypothetical protein CONLIGDRAFT_633094 [Coniochaeta ligniaria NRRL 30616]|uniref:Uncharacterized protein n=1 Tax=Coniochaeta ligniaria NRRL 30616 TaxID=1408157 RepID=A0A1J7INE3_9PEZI|nr:hypothetical protein CONLIGDRAFT_633094 [Coniochaeta ligniaria NRRL 30616]